MTRGCRRRILAHNDSALALEARSVTAGYARRTVIRDVTLGVAPGEVVALFGHNGAGKTTTLVTLMGLIKPTSGQVWVGDRAVTGADPATVHSAGASYVPSQDFVFGALTVAENIRLGVPGGTARSEANERLAAVEALFPVLAERRKQVASTLSGGQQRMLSIGVALMSNPRILLLDEPSLGLSPALTESLMAAIRHLAAERGVAVLLLEQNVIAACSIADRAYIMRGGKIVHETTGAELRARESYWDIA